MRSSITPRARRGTADVEAHLACGMPSTAASAASRSSPARHASARASMRSSTGARPGTGRRAVPSQPSAQASRAVARPSSSSASDEQRTRVISRPTSMTSTPAGRAKPSAMRGVKSPEERSASAGATSRAGAIPETTSALARAMFSRLPRSPMWLVPTLVTQARAGRQAAARRSISPAWFMPSSQTSTSAPSGAESTVSGRPIRLLRLPSVAWVRRCDPKAAASMSLVVVLPTDPVTPTTSHSGWSARTRAARRSRNSSQSSEAARSAAQPREPSSASSA